MMGFEPVSKIASKRPAIAAECILPARGRSSVGRATASQAVGRGFETRRPLLRLRLAIAAGFLAVAAGAAAIVVVSRADEAADRGRLVAFDLRSGEVRFASDAPTASTHIHAIGADAVVLTGADACDIPGKGSETAFAYSLPSGALRWQRPGRGCFDYDNPSVASHGAVVMAGPEAWRLSDGRTLWQQPSVRPSSYQPIGTSTVAVSIHFDTATVSVMDWKTGRVRRTFEVPFRPSPWFMHANTAVLVAQRWAPLKPQALAAVDLRSGRVLWRRSIGTHPHLYGRTAGADGVILAYSANSEDRRPSTPWAAVALDERTGNVLWRRVLPAVADPAYAPAITAVGAGLAVGRDGSTITARDLRTGEVRWQASVASAAGDEQAKVVAAGGVVGVIDTTGVSVLDAADGHLLWFTPASWGGWIGEPAISKGLLLVPYTSSTWVPYRG